MRSGMGPRGLGNLGPDSLSPPPQRCWPGARSPASRFCSRPPLCSGQPREAGQQPREGQGRGWGRAEARQGPGRGRAGAGLTVDSELKVLGLLAGRADGCTLVPPLVAQVAAGDSEQLAVLQELDVRVPGKDGPGKEVRTVRLGSRRAGAAAWSTKRLRESQSPKGANRPSARRRR